MTINRIATDLPTTTKIKRLNDMILEVNGLVSKAKFDKNELDHLYDIVGSYRKFKRDVGIGNTVSTYTGWTHLQAEAGYSIWKYTPTTYIYNALNNLYFDDKVLENRGEAATESSTAFGFVYLHNLDSGSGFVDNTTEAGTEGGTAFEVNDTKQDILYLGHASKYGGAKFEWSTRGSNYTLVVAYYNGSSWTTMTENDNNLEDGTSNFGADGHISWDIPSNWATTSINSQSAYWIRITSTTDPFITATASLIVPNTSVVGLLALSSSEILSEEWAWCTFSSSIYTTIRNTGNSSFEGDFYITSASSSANKQNFFVHNHPFTADYEDSSYTGTTTITTSTLLDVDDGIIFVNAASGIITVSLPSAVNISGTKYYIKVTNFTNAVSIDPLSGETIDAAGTYSFSALNESILIVSDNSNWKILAKKA